MTKSRRGELKYWERAPRRGELARTADLSGGGGTRGTRQPRATARTPVAGRWSGTGVAAQAAPRRLEGGVAREGFTVTNPNRSVRWRG